MNVVLIGMRGSGKTTVAKILANKLKKNHIDLDEEFIRKNKTTIKAFVDKHGWEGFRQEEAIIAASISGRENHVISAGGGVILNEQNVKNLKEHGTLVYLQTSVETILQRINIDAERPSLTNHSDPRAEMNELLEQRKPLYETAAHIIVQTDLLSPEHVADEIIKKLDI